MLLQLDMAQRPTVTFAIVVTPICWRLAIPVFCMATVTPAAPLIPEIALEALKVPALPPYESPPLPPAPPLPPLAVEVALPLEAINVQFDYKIGPEGHLIQTQIDDNERRLSLWKEDLRWYGLKIQDITCS